MPAGPLARLPDGVPGLLLEGYRWASNTCDAAGRDAAATRLMLRRTVVLRGAANARRFYGDGLVRAGAAPTRLQRTLFGVGGVQGLDGAAHRHRKAMLLGVLAPEAAEALAGDLLGRWRERLPAWEAASEVNLFAEVGQLLCATVCDWSGVPLPDRDVPARTRQLEALIDAGSGVAGRYWRARLARRRLEAWLAELVGQVRAGALTPRSGSALAVVAEHRELDGALLAPRVAAVDLLNVLRPTVAIDRFVVFLALALHQHPQWRSRLARAGTAAAGPDADDEVHRFVLEVRRLAPFFPLVAARAGSRLELDGLPVPVGTRVLLDLYGTNRDPSGWADPEAFDPDRFRGRQPGPYDFVPQGGGAHATGHRCAGEWVTAAVLHAATRLLTAEIEYEVVAGQDLRVSLRRIPTLPASGFRISHVRRLPPAGEG